MANIRVTCRAEVEDNLSSLPARVARATQEATEEGTDILHTASVASIRKRTGRTARDIRKATRNFPPHRFEGEVFITNPVGSYLYHGTGIHGPEGRPIVITPKQKRSLHWTSQGRSGFRKRVTVLGTRGDLWMQTAAEGAEAAIVAAFDTRLARALS